MLFSESTFSLDARKMEETVFRNCLKNEKISWYFPGSLPGHSTIDSKVERVGETDESIDCKDYVLGNVVVKQDETKTKKDQKIIIRNTRVDDCLAPAWESVEHGDDHQRNLSAEKECNDYNQHQGHFLEVSLAATFSNQAAANK